VKRPFFLIPLLAVFISSFLVSESRAQVLDQISDSPATTNGWAIGDRNAQTITVGFTGYLSRIDLQIYQSDEFASGDLAVDLFELTASGAPDINNLVGSATPADFSSQTLFFEAGDRFAIVPRRTNLSNWGAPPWMIWGGAGNTSSYDSGDFYLDFQGGWQRRSGAHGFQTFMVPSEPPTILLGDCDLDGAVTFEDISQFIGYLSFDIYLEEADCDQDGDVDFSDIDPFIEILTGS